MFKKINIITTVIMTMVASALIIYYYDSKNITALASAGIVAMAWFIIIFCKAVKNPGVAKKNNVQE